ncbi:MAG: glutaredoxin 3 [Casimicrobiaceae bacterium]
MDAAPSAAHTPTVSMYTAAYCGYCVRAERLLESKGVADIVKLRVDEDPALRAEMMHRTGRRTVPQIYIGEFHVGGYDDLAALDRQGRLDPLLAGAHP